MRNRPINILYSILASCFLLLNSFSLTATDQPLQVIVIGAHPDDADLCAGGTAALWASKGHQVKFLSLTNGDAGHQSMGGGALAKRRRAEAQESARRLGIAEYEVLDNHDGELIPSLAVRLQVIRRIRQWKADIVIVSRPNDYHPDHRNTGLVVQDAAYMVIVPNVASDTPPLEKNPVFLYCEDRFVKPTPFEPDIAVNIDAVAHKKLAALDAHESQFYEWLPWTMGQLENVPTSKTERKEWLKKWRTRPIKLGTQKALIKWYGEAAAEQVKQAEAFEICEYGRQPDEATLAQLFPMLDSDHKTIVAQKTKEKITIDGHLSEAFYQTAPKFYLKNSMTSATITDPNYISYAQIAHDDTYLYIAFSCQDADIHSRYTKRDEFLWKDEVVEVFIDTDEQPNNYVEVEVSPNNVFFDSYIVNPTKIDVPATAQFNLNDYRTAVQVNGTTDNRTDTDTNWTVEMAIPLKELVANYSPKKLASYRWKINFYRINHDKSSLEYMAWLPTGGSFHQPDKFGVLVFGE